MNMKNKPFKAGVIGLGVGMHHLKALEAHTNCKVKKVYDFDKLKCAKLKKKYPNIEFVKNEKEIFLDDEINIVSIASYDNFHYQQILDCIKNKKNIIIEKPICLNQRQLTNIKKKLKNSNINITSNLVLRTTSLFKHIKKKVMKKQIISIEADYLWGRAHKLYEWRSKIKDYSIIHGCAIHVIDLVVWILNKKPIKVYAMGNNIGINSKKFTKNSYVIIMLKFSNNLIVKVTANASSVYPHFHELKIFSKNSTIIHNLQGSFELKNKKMKVLKFNYPDKMNRFQIIHSFIDNLKNRYKKTIVNKKDIFDTMSICLAAEKSLKLNKEVKIKYEN
tara:strand:+ start:150 stop:1148 length:999 start_codon:yes stop_codon:yes gene_type:complete